MELIQLVKKDKKILERLLQLYLHDISDYFPINFNNQKACYLYDSLLKYFDNSNNYAYLIKNGEETLGFMLIDQIDNEIVMQEMFILNHHKNKGIGQAAVNMVFDKHKGNWLIKSLPCSESSERFWQKVIKSYTNDNFQVDHVGKYNRAVFKFNNN
ncbi:MAG TPA: GNAT family N-acetyltransferase [Bacilli bacterium]|nr:GNAT family N-acetyltransferase [Bacilli bacterium]